MARATLTLLGFSLLVLPATAVQAKSFLATSSKASVAQQREAEKMLQKSMSQLSSALRSHFGHTGAIDATQFPMLAAKARDLLRREAGQLHSDNGADLMRNFATWAPDYVLVVPMENENGDDEAKMGHDLVQKPSRLFGSQKICCPMIPNVCACDRDSEPNPLHQAMEGISEQMSDLSSMVGPSLSKQILGAVFNKALEQSSLAGHRNAKSDHTRICCPIQPGCLCDRDHISNHKNAEDSESNGDETAKHTFGDLIDYVVRTDEGKRQHESPKTQEEKEFDMGWDLGKDLAGKIFDSIFDASGQTKDAAMLKKPLPSRTNEESEVEVRDGKRVTRKVNCVDGHCETTIRMEIA